MIDRRSRRSAAAPEALILLLESHRAKLPAAVLAVTTRDGQVLAAVGDRRELARAGGAVATWQLQAGGQEVIVSSVGGHMSHDVGAGVKRILG
jgi:hypothetical protein